MKNVLTHDDGEPVWNDTDAHLYKDILLYSLKRKLSNMNDFAMSPTTHSLLHGKMEQMQEVIDYIENETI